MAGDPKAASALLHAHRAIEVSDLTELTEVLAACQGSKRATGRRIGIVTSSGGLAEIILDIADTADLELPPLSASARNDIVARIGFITGDGNPLDAWGSGTFVANLPQALSLFDASPDHDIVVFCRDNSDDPAFDTPELVRTYIDLFTRAAAQSRKPHYLLHSRPGIMDRALVAQLRERGIAVVGGLREGLSAVDRLARLAGRANS
jgi:acyl-CoA synthetase (NDP forming)